MASGVGQGKDADGPLAGLRVIEVAVWHAGPGTAGILCDLGAEVIKVEALRGDPERIGRLPLQGRTTLDGESDFAWLFEISNRGKKGISLDVAHPKGYEILSKLVRSADIFVTNLRPETAQSLKIDFPSLSSLNSRIIHVSISGYGQSGPMASLGGFDSLGQALSGMMYMADAEAPNLLDVIPLDQLAAITGSHAAITALYQRERTGVGEEVHVSLYGSALWLQYANIYGASLLGVEPRNYGHRTTLRAMITSYQCADGAWIIACLNPEEKYWPSLCATIGRPELETDSRFVTAADRLANNSELIAILESSFAERPRAEWLKELHSAGLLFAPINTAVEVVGDPQAHANGYIESFDHPKLGPVRAPGFPVTFGAGKAFVRGPAPDLGQHTHAVLSELGLDGDQIAELTQANVIR